MTRLAGAVRGFGFHPLKINRISAFRPEARASIRSGYPPANP
jgi:hypothetical protein